MDYTLTDALRPARSRSHYYVRLSGEEELGALIQQLGQPAVWQVACKLSGPIDAAGLVAHMHGARDLAVWAMHQSAGDARVASCVVSTHALDWHLAVVHEAKFSLTRHVEAIDQLASVVFRARPEVNEVWTALPLPEPDSAAETLAALGFTQVHSDLDQGRQRTYGLFRHVWSAYQQPA